MFKMTKWEREKEGKVLPYISEETVNESLDQLYDTNFDWLIAKKDNKKEVKNTIYIFTDGFLKTYGIYLDFGIFKRMMFKDEDYDRDYFHHVSDKVSSNDFKVYFKIETHGETYQLNPHEVKYVDVTGKEQMVEFIKSL